MLLWYGLASPNQVLKTVIPRVQQEVATPKVFDEFEKRC